MTSTAPSSRRGWRARVPVAPHGSAARFRELLPQPACARLNQARRRHPGYRPFQMLPHQLHTATVLSPVFFFEWLEPAATFLLFDPCVIPVAPVGRRQICPPYTAREQVFTVVAHHAKKFVVGLKNATIEIPDENSDDVGIDKAPDLRFAFPQCFLGVLAPRHIDLCADRINLLEQRASNQHRNAAAILPKILLLVWRNSPSRAQFGTRAFITLSPFGRRQIGPAHATGD